jgi:hypothetical protein
MPKIITTLPEAKARAKHAHAAARAGKTVAADTRYSLTASSCVEARYLRTARMKSRRVHMLRSPKKSSQSIWRVSWALSPKRRLLLRLRFRKS